MFLLISCFYPLCRVGDGGWIAIAVTLIAYFESDNTVLSTQLVLNKCKMTSSSSLPLALYLPPSSVRPCFGMKPMPLGGTLGCDRFQAWVGMAPREDLGCGPLCSLGPCVCHLSALSPCDFQVTLQGLCLAVRDNMGAGASPLLLPPSWLWEPAHTAVLFHPAACGPLPSLHVFSHLSMN